MKKIALIGAGQLGSRHLQGLAKSDLEISIEVVEPFESSINIAKQRFEEISPNERIIKIDFLEIISQLSDELDLVIVATNADVRYKVVKELLESKKVRNLVLEKVLFQKIDEYKYVEELLDISEKFGADIIKRPKELANDTATTFDALEHTIDNLEKYDYIVLLQPTSPLRNEKHIDEAIELLEQKNADAIISVCEIEHSPLWCNTLPENGSMGSFLKDKVLNKRSQDLDKYFRLNGAIYICKMDKLLENKSFFIKENIYAYVMNKKVSIDIDDEFDFLMAEYIIIKEYN